ncbi:MAG: MATE family efflux transporter, partial [Paramuribaculum sp.]|nr:MATE family efflux transporter [Paramuribaculum sp.]
MDRQLLRSIAALSLPAVVTNITTPLLALCDVAIVGHMGSAVFIAAIAVGGTMFNMLYWLCGFLRMGSSGTTAQAFGAGNLTAVHAVVKRAMAIAFIIAMAFISLSKPIGRMLLDFIDAEPAAREMALEYFSICIWGAPAVLGTFVLTGWFIGLQNSRTPMWISIFINIFNIAVSLTLVYGAGMKISGVAFGTLSAQWGGFIMGSATAIRKYGMVSISLKKLLDWNELNSFLRINSDIFLRTLCLVAVTLWFTRTGAMQGTVMLAVNTLLMQMFTIFSYMMDGIAFAGEALCGRYIGAGNTTRLRQTIG